MSEVRAIRPTVDGEASPGDTACWGDLIVLACWWNVYLGELVPADYPPGEDELDCARLWWVAGLEDAVEEDSE